MNLFPAKNPAARSRPQPTRIALAIALACACATAAQAQDKTVTLDRIQVTGSHIRKAEMEGQVPVLNIGREQIENSGLVSIGDFLQRLTSSGKALNTQFNTSGNAGAPPDGGGIGAGSTQIDLRHLGSKRVLVLVDGKRWVYESSASGVGGAADLNTIPLSIVERIEVLGDGASAVYGSDAIAGVVNVVTRRDFEGAEIVGSYGRFEDGDGETSRAEMTFGGGDERFRGVFSASFQEQKAVSSGDREISATSPAGVTRGSPATPQGRAIFVSPTGPVSLCPLRDLNGDGNPDAPFCDITTPSNAPLAGNGSPAFPAGFVRYTDDQSFNAQPFNLVLTPNKRKSLFGSAEYAIADGLKLYAKALYNTRESANQAAANPIVIGQEAPGNGLADRIGVSRLNPFNPFGRDLLPIAQGGTMIAVARRPLEGGPRIFEQTVDTYYLGTGLEGEFAAGSRQFYWDLNYISTQNRAEQRFRNTYNMRRVQLALGDPAQCAATPGCVPLNLFGGMGPDGRGTITPEMLSWIRTEVRDASEQKLQLASANLSGDLFDLPSGPLAFATGFEHRRYVGSFTPDAARVAGEIPDQAATVATRGEYDVDEFYGELDAPLLSDKPFAKDLRLSLAMRYSDYSTFGDVTTSKLGFQWRPHADLLVRSTYSEGFRAPFIGELFGLSQFGASITDPCSGYATSGNAQLIANCQALGVPAAYKQLGFQIFTTTGGNADLEPETSESWSFGVVYSPGWIKGSGFADLFDIEATYYRHHVESAIQAPDAQDVLDACVASANPASPSCSGIVRSGTGTIASFDNRLANIGDIETSGLDLNIEWGLDTRYGRFGANWQNTYVERYEASDSFGNRFSRTVGVEENDSAIPRVQSKLTVDWHRNGFGLGWTARYTSSLTERCSDAFDSNPALSLTAMGLCSQPNFQNPSLSRDKLGATTYHDFFASWDQAFGVSGLRLALNLNNAFDKDPRMCFSCALNGYDPSTYDVPGRFWNMQAAYRF